MKLSPVMRSTSQTLPSNVRPPSGSAADGATVAMAASGAPGAAAASRSRLGATAAVGLAPSHGNGLAPQLDQRPAGAIDRVLARQLDLGDRGQGVGVVDLLGSRLVIAAARGIGADHQEVVAGRHAAMANAG